MDNLDFKAKDLIAMKNGSTIVHKEYKYAVFEGEIHRIFDSGKSQSIKALTGGRVSPR